MIKVRRLYFLKLFKLQKIKYLYFFHFWPLGQDIDDLCFLQVFTFGWNHLKVKSLFPKDCTVIFKVNNQHPSDMVRFLGMTKSKKKIIKNTSYIVPLNSTIQCNVSRGISLTKPDTCLSKSNLIFGWLDIDIHTYLRIKLKCKTVPYRGLLDFSSPSTGHQWSLKLVPRWKIVIFRQTK